MKEFMCKIFDHKWNSGWAGAKGGPLGAVVVNYKMCDRCGKSEYNYSTKIKLDRIFIDPTENVYRRNEDEIIRSIKKDNQRI